jgi:cell division protein FtsB
MNDEQLAAPPIKRRRRRNILAVAAAVVVIGALASIATIALLRNATLSSQVAAADARAANVQKDYTARNAALNQEAAALNQKSQTIAAEIGELKANTIRADGLYLVGHDINSGTWHTAGGGHLSGGFCRFSVIDSASKSNTLPGSIYFDGPWTVHLSGAYGFYIDGTCTWIREPS